jgi:hypothetical protein
MPGIASDASSRLDVQSTERGRNARVWRNVGRVETAGVILGAGSISVGVGLEEEGEPPPEPAPSPVRLPHAAS